MRMYTQTLLHSLVPSTIHIHKQDRHQLHGLVSNTVSICKQERHHYIMKPVLFASSFASHGEKKVFALC